MASISATTLTVFVLLMATGMAQAFLGPGPFVHRLMPGPLPRAKPTTRWWQSTAPDMFEMFTKRKAAWGASSSGVAQARSEASPLKVELLELVSGTRRGASTTAEQREAIDALVTKLEALNPTPDSASSPLLTGRWDLQWTTEKEVLFLVEKGFFGLATQDVFQAIDVGERSLQNTLEFDGGSFFSVDSSITPEEEGPRVAFQFRACTAKYRGLTVPLPPFGKGWFDNIYLDAGFRVSRDVRGDLQVAVRNQP